MKYTHALYMLKVKSEKSGNLKMFLMSILNLKCLCVGNKYRMNEVKALMELGC